MPKLAYNIPGVNNLISVNVGSSHSSPVYNAVIKCESTTLDIGDSVTIDLGYSTGTGRVFRGFVKQVDVSNPDGSITLTASSDLVRAIDYFIASNDPEQPFKRSNIKAEDLVRDILALAGLNNYQYTATNFTFGVNSPVEVNLVSAYDFCKLIADILSWHLYDDTSGTVHFKNRKPYVMDGNSGQPGDIADVSKKTVTGKLKIQKTNSEKDLRNRIVVYGRNGISAEAKQSSPYLPSGFYKTAVLASEWIDTTSMAQTAADYNLQMLNRLSTFASIEIVGDYEINARDVITVVDTFTGMSGLWYVFSAEHRMSSAGYITSLQLRK